MLVRPRWLVPYSVSINYRHAVVYAPTLSTTKQSLLTTFHHWLRNHLNIFSELNSSYSKTTVFAEMKPFLSIKFFVVHAEMKPFLSIKFLLLQWYCLIYNFTHTEPSLTSGIRLLTDILSITQQLIPGCFQTWPRVGSLIRRTVGQLTAAFLWSFKKHEKVISFW